MDQALVCALEDGPCKCVHVHYNINNCVIVTMHLLEPLIKLYCLGDVTINIPSITLATNAPTFSAAKANDFNERNVCSVLAVFDSYDVAVKQLIGVLSS